LVWWKRATDKVKVKVKVTSLYMPQKGISAEAWKKAVTKPT
jgi:hypothetical protein